MKQQSKLSKQSSGQQLNGAESKTQTQAYDPLKKARGSDKLSKIPVKVENPQAKVLPKPPWLRIKISDIAKISELKKKFKNRKLYTVCEEASCPNLAECYSHGTATFMIMGDKCTRRCSFCDVAHGRPDPLDTDEPNNLALTVSEMGLKYVVITSVDRDDLRDGGAEHYTLCINALRQKCPGVKIEVLVPDFRGRLEKAFIHIAKGLPDVFNHNIETVPRLYKVARAGANYDWSLKLLYEFKQRFSGIPTKSGIMLGLGETNDEIIEVLQDLRHHEVDMLTLGQYLQPSPAHMAVARYVTPEEFEMFRVKAVEMGFEHVASGPLVRSSYHADLQAQGEVVR